MNSPPFCAPSWINGGMSSRRLTSERSKSWRAYLRPPLAYVRLWRERDVHKLGVVLVHECAASALRPRRPRARAVATLVRARLRTAQVEWHLAIVDPLLVARLAAEPLLGGASRLDVARFAVGTRGGTGGCHHEQERPRHHADRSTRHHARRIAHRRAFRFDRGRIFGRDRSVCHEHRQLRVAENVAGGAAKDHLAQSALGVGALDQEIAAQRLRVRQNRLARQAAVKTDAQRFCRHAIKLQIATQLLPGWSGHRRAAFDRQYDDAAGTLEDGHRESRETRLLGAAIPRNQNIRAHLRLRRWRCDQDRPAAFEQG